MRRQHRSRTRARVIAYAVPADQLRRATRIALGAGILASLAVYAAAALLF